MGCLPGFGRAIAGSFFGLGAFLASTAMRGISFLFVTVVGPLLFGSAREFIIRIMRVSNDGRSPQSRWRIGSKTAYAILSGIAWVAAFLLLRIIWLLLEWAGVNVMRQLPPGLATWLPRALLVLVIFAAGLIIGMQVHRHADQPTTGW